MAAVGLLVTSLGAWGCASALSFDGTSESIGSHANGALRHPAILLTKGDGYSIGEPWRQRHSNRGSDELVEAIVRGSRVVARTQAGSVAAIGDLSHAGGGGSAEHKSHQSGRDVDIFYYALHPNGLPALPGEAMIHYDRAGRSVAWSPARGHRAPPEAVPEVRFDNRRNWRMVRSLLLDPDVEVQWIFVQRDSEPHDDHMHVRVFCDPDDRDEGCVDKGPPRWWKKHWKYMRPPFGRPGGAEVRSLLLDVLRTRVPLPLGGAKLTT